MINIIYLFIKQIGVSRVSLRKITQAYEQHPSKRSIRCVSDILDRFNIPNMVCQLTLEQLREVEAPYLVMLNTSSDYLCIVEKIDGNNIVLKTEKTTKTHSLEYFKEIWTGVVIGAENSNEVIKEPIFLYYVNQFIAYVDNRVYSIILALISALLFILVAHNSVGDMLYCGLTALGLVVSLIVMRKTLFDPRLFDIICRVGKKVNCNDEGFAK